MTQPPKMQSNEHERLNTEPRVADTCIVSLFHSVTEGSANTHIYLLYDSNYKIKYRTFQCKQSHFASYSWLRVKKRKSKWSEPSKSCLKTTQHEEERLQVKISKRCLKLVRVYRQEKRGNFQPRDSHFNIAEAWKKYLDEAEASNRCALVSLHALAAARRASAARTSTPASSTRPVIQNKRLLRLSALVQMETERPIHLLHLATCGYAKVLDEWGETYRNLFGATHGQSASACIVVEPNRTSALSVLPPWKLRASVPQGFFLRLQQRHWIEILSQQVTTKKVGGKSFSQDVTSW